jgi:hypothetical protein
VNVAEEARRSAATAVAIVQETAAPTAEQEVAAAALTAARDSADAALAAAQEAASLLRAGVRASRAISAEIVNHLAVLRGGIR